MATDIWEMLEQDAPSGCAAVQDLYSWSLNYDAGDGPFALLLDMIGWSDEEFGAALYGPTRRYGEGYQRTGSWDERLGYMEISKLAAAMSEYAESPGNVRAYIDALMAAEASA